MGMIFGSTIDFKTNNKAGMCNAGKDVLYANTHTHIHTHKHAYTNYT